MTVKPPPKSPSKKPPAGKNAPPAPVAEVKQPVKKFNIRTGSEKRGSKIIIHGKSGIGKSSLAVLAPGPVILPLDDGSANLRDPKTNELVREVEGIESFRDVRSALQQHDLYSDDETVIIDTVTKMQDMSHPYLFETVKHEKGHTVKSIEGYGYGKGYTHLYDAMKLILQDCDALVRAGKNVIMIAQSVTRSIANAGGDDYLSDCPRLYPGGNKGQNHVENMYCEWADHVLFVGHVDTVVTDKKISGDVTRAIYTQAELHFKAKTRVLESGATIPPVVTFNDPTDNSIWRFMFDVD
jgi:hypothetical protein